MPPIPAFTYTSAERPAAAGETAQIVYQARALNGWPNAQDFGMALMPLPALDDGDVAVQTTFLSVDPYMRPAMNSFTPATTVDPGAPRVDPELDPAAARKVLGGGCVGKATAPRSPRFREGDLVSGGWGWCDRAVCPAAALTKPAPHAAAHPSRAPNFYGMPGLTAFFGLNEVLQAKAGEVLFVSGGAGAVGATVALLAKQRGCAVLGSAGSAAKLAYMTNELGYDGVFNYKDEPDAGAALRRLAPRGLDLYFDNVGGDTSVAAYLQLNAGARVAVCGCIHLYNEPNIPLYLVKKVLGVGCGRPWSVGLGLAETVHVDFALGLAAAYARPQPTQHLQIGGCCGVGGRAVTWRSFNVMNFAWVETPGGTEATSRSNSPGAAALAAEQDMAGMVARGELPGLGRADTLPGGLEATPEAFMRMLRGENLGKQVVKNEAKKKRWGIMTL